MPLIRVLNAPTTRSHLAFERLIPALCSAFAGPAMTEADPACFRGASVLMDTEEARLKAGDLLNAIAAEALHATDIRVDAPRKSAPCSRR